MAIKKVGKYKVGKHELDLWMGDGQRNVSLDSGQTLDAGSTNLFAHYNIPGGLNNQVLSAGPHYATPAKAHLDAGDVIEVSMDSAGASALDVSFTFVLFFDTSSPVTRPAIEP